MIAGTMTTEPMSAEPVRTQQAARPVAGQQLHIKGAGVDRLLQAGSAYRVGRDPQADIVVSDARVSWQHATVERHASGWQLQDAGSTNGTFVDRQRIRQVAITGNCAVRLGHPDDGPLLRCTVIGAPADASAAPVQVQAATAVLQSAEPAAPAAAAIPAPAAGPFCPPARLRRPSPRRPGRPAAAAARARC